MAINCLITENQLDNWVRSNEQIARGLIVELVSRLVEASSPHPKARRFPLGDSIGQHGSDGELDAVIAYDPFIPGGMSYWEIGTGKDAKKKANGDYKALTKVTPPDVRRDSVFIFVTPHSGTSGWRRSWKKDGQNKWVLDRKAKSEWRDVRIIDGTVLIDWVHCFPAVEVWLAGEMGYPAHQMQTPEQRWQELRTVIDSPPLPASLFLANRGEACKKLEKVFSKEITELKFDTHFPEQIADFVAAFFEDWSGDARNEAIGRCLIISSSDAWDYVIAKSEPQILIAAFDLQEIGSIGRNPLERARSAGHTVIFGGSPGGMRQKNRVILPNPEKYQIERSLKEAGYDRERARNLSQKCSGNLTSLLKSLENLPLEPVWAKGADAPVLAIAVLLGSWDENYAADIELIEGLTGRSYKEWISALRAIASRPGTPVSHKNGKWKFSPRFEGWYALGPYIFDDDLDGLGPAIVVALIERDPRITLQLDQIFIAKSSEILPRCSPTLRGGLANCLAFLGSHSEALQQCSSGKAKRIARSAVTKILSGADWALWASLDPILPFLAEAAPREFLDAVESKIDGDTRAFEDLFAQKNLARGGSNYTVGLLWALETLAWSPDLLIRVVDIFGELASQDPGGNWENRPINSLTTILLPWFPQTCAPFNKRKTAVEMLIRKHPQIAWDLVISLLPGIHQTTSGSHQPVWREIIPDDWSQTVTKREYWNQVTVYANMLIDMAEADFERLPELIRYFDHLPPDARNRLLAYLESPDIVEKSEAERIPLWNQLKDLVAKHRKYSGARWAMSTADVDAVAAVANRLAPATPFFLHQRLFSNRGRALFEERSNLKELQERLANEQQIAIAEITAMGGFSTVIEFACKVDSPGSVGFAFGKIPSPDADRIVLPDLLNPGERCIEEFVRGFIKGRLTDQHWDWVDQIVSSAWEPSQVAWFLSCLPFTNESWNRAAQLLGSKESEYWQRTGANPFDVGVEECLEIPVDRLITIDRAVEALRFVMANPDNRDPLYKSIVVRTLLAAAPDSDKLNYNDVIDIQECIKQLQEDPTVNPEDLCRVEWAYLPQLDHYLDASPKYLERQLAEKPEFFCRMIRAAYPLTNEGNPRRDLSPEEQSNGEKAAHLLSYWSIPPGYQQDGSYDGKKFSSWLATVEKDCSETGHLQIAMFIIGRVLIHAPEDEGGLWIHNSAAAALDEKGRDDMRAGFNEALFNSGDCLCSLPEEIERDRDRARRSKTETYREKADSVEAEGYPRFAETLRSLAEEYESIAESGVFEFPRDDY